MVWGLVAHHHQPTLPLRYVHMGRERMVVCGESHAADARCACVRARTMVQCAWVLTASAGLWSGSRSEVPAVYWRSMLG